VLCECCCQIFWKVVQCDALSKWDCLRSSYNSQEQCGSLCAMSNSQRVSTLNRKNLFYVNLTKTDFFKMFPICRDSVVCCPCLFLCKNSSGIECDSHNMCIHNIIFFFILAFI
jgi:hypothetical protein